MEQSEDVAQTQEDSSESSLLHDLAHMKLTTGETAEAQKLFRKALRNQASGSELEQPVSAGQDGIEEWEAKWDAFGGREKEHQEIYASKTIAEPWPESLWNHRKNLSTNTSTDGKRKQIVFRDLQPAPEHMHSNSSSWQAGAQREELPFGGAHILEVYNLISAVKTSDLECFINQNASTPNEPPLIKWVDEDKALLIFTDPKAAQHTLQAVTLNKDAEYSVRTFAESSDLSQSVAVSDLQPPKPRPLTTASVARRLIGSALNIKLQDKEEEKLIAAARRDIKAAEAHRRQMQDAIWGD